MQASTSAIGSKFTLRMYDSSTVMYRTQYCTVTEDNGQPPSSPPIRIQPLRLSDKPCGRNVVSLAGRVQRRKDPDGRHRNGRGEAAVNDFDLGLELIASTICNIYHREIVRQCCHLLMNTQI